jgi:hypothetical protein
VLLLASDGLSETRGAIYTGPRQSQPVVMASTCMCALLILLAQGPQVSAQEGQSPERMTCPPPVGLDQDAMCASKSCKLHCACKWLRKGCPALATRLAALGDACNHWHPVQTLPPPEQRREFCPTHQQLSTTPGAALTNSPAHEQVLVLRGASKNLDYNAGATGEYVLAPGRCDNTTTFAKEAALYRGNAPGFLYRRRNPLDGKRYWAIGRGADGRVDCSAETLSFDTVGSPEACGAGPPTGVACHWRECQGSAWCEASWQGSSEDDNPSLRIWERGPAEPEPEPGIASLPPEIRTQEPPPPPAPFRVRFYLNGLIHSQADTYVRPAPRRHIHLMSVAAT